MKLILTTLGLFLFVFGFAQAPRITSTLLQDPLNDSLIKDYLVAQAMNNPALKSATAMTELARHDLKRAKASWLNMIVLSGNINEFVVNDTKINGLNQASLYPKYNAGVNIPLGIFSRQEKNMAKDKHQFSLSEKELKVRELLREVLTRYELYKEKLDLLELQKQLTTGQFSSYQQKQADYASGETRDMKEVNKEYEQWMEQRSKQRTKEKDLLLAEYDLQEIIGMKVAEAIQKALAVPAK